MQVGRFIDDGDGYYHGPAGRGVIYHCGTGGGSKQL
jgi:hypothetical protein